MRKGKLKLLFITIFIVVFVAAMSSSIVAFADNAIPAVNIVMLERIPDTPFAVRVEKSIRVKVYDGNRISINDVVQKIGKKAYGLLNSYCERFEYNALTDQYIAIYEKSVYVNAKTTDGNVEHYFLDLNNSFYDYYVQFVAYDERAGLDNVYLSATDSNISVYAGSHGGGGTGGSVSSGVKIISKDLFSWYYNRIHSSYEQLNGLKADEIYGYWGFVAIPHSNSINDILSTDIFSVSPTYKGVLEQHRYQDVLTKNGYDSLLNDYNYNWIERLWADFLATLTDEGSCSADFYLFYANGEEDTAFIADNGASDINDNRPGTIIKGEETIKNTLNELKNLVSSDDFKKAIGIILGVLALCLVAYILFKLTPLLRRMNRKESEKRKKNEEKEARAKQRSLDKERRKRERLQKKKGV